MNAPTPHPSVSLARRRDEIGRIYPGAEICAKGEPHITARANCGALLRIYAADEIPVCGETCRCNAHWRNTVRERT